VGRFTRVHREELLKQMVEATTPNEISTAVANARGWLRHHPRDHEVALSIAKLLELEREVLSLPA
jgi:hypothetical protein